MVRRKEKRSVREYGTTGSSFSWKGFPIFFCVFCVCSGRRVRHFTGGK